VGGNAENTVQSWNGSRKILEHLDSPYPDTPDEEMAPARGEEATTFQLRQLWWGKL